MSISAFIISKKRETASRFNIVKGSGPRRLPEHEPFLCIFKYYRCNKASKI